jgi:hypothetical protein
MRPRGLLLLLIAALAASGVAVWLSSQRHIERGALEGSAVLPGLKAVLNDVTQLHTAKADGSRATLQRGASGWSVVERGYPADSGKVRKALLDLADLRVVEEKTSDPANYPVLGVEDLTSLQASGVGADISASGKSYSLIVGKPAGQKHSFVRVAGAKTSLLAEPQLTLDADPKQWLAHELLDISAERVREVAVTLPAGSYTAARSTPQQTDYVVAGVPKGRALDSPAAANPLASALSGLALEDVHALTTAPAAASYRAVVQTFDGLIVELHGRKDGDHHYITPTARYDAAVRDSVAAVAPVAKAPAAAQVPSPQLLPVAQVQAEAQTLNQRAKGFEFEIPGYKFEALFRPLEDMLKKTPSKAKPAAPKPSAGGVKAPHGSSAAPPARP